VSTLAQAGTVYPISANGSRTVSNYLPLYCVARFDFAVASGRPSRKYMRMPIPREWNTNGQFETTTIPQMNAAYSTPLLAVDGICDNSGQPFLSGGVIATIGMRQLRRGSRKRTTPIIP